MSGLFFRKDTNFDTKIRPQEDTKYDTYRLWGKDPDTRDVAFDIYVKIPKEESIGNLVPKLANITTGPIKEIKEKREPMLFYFDDLASSSLTIDPNIDLKIDPSLELHVKKVKLEDVKDFSFMNASGAKREVYIDGLYLEDIVGSSITFAKDGYKESNKDTKISYDNAHGLHIEASDMDSLDFAGVVCYDVNTDCTPENNRKIVLDSRTVKRTSFTITSTDINFESTMGGNTQVYIANTGGSISGSILDFSFVDNNTIQFGGGTVLYINKANIKVEDARVVGPSNGTLFISTPNDDVRDEVDFLFRGVVDITPTTYHNMENKHPYIRLNNSGTYQDALIYYLNEMAFEDCSLIGSTLKIEEDKPAKIANVSLLGSSLVNPISKEDEEAINLQKLDLTHANLAGPQFIYNDPKASGSITINGIGEYHQFFKNCKFIVEDNKNQEIAYDTGKVEVGKIENSGIFENTFFEGRVELSATNTRRIKSSIFKNTNTVLNSLEGFDRCEFNGDNNISSIAEKVNNVLFQNARCKNVTGLSFNCIKDFVGADGSYQELSGQTDEKLKITEKLDIL